MSLSLRGLFTGVFILLFFYIAIGNLLDPDLWWHLRTGQFIVETHTIPHADIFSFTRAGNEWVTHEWLTEVIMYGVYSAFGIGGLILLFSALATGAFTILFLRNTGHLFTAGAALLSSSLTAWPLFTPRPWLFSALLVSLYLYGLDRYARSGKTRTLWSLPLLMVLWVNLHGAFGLGLVLIALYALGIAVDDFIEQKPANEIVRHLYPLGLALGGSAIAILVNPNGARMYTYPFETLGSPAMQQLITEWFSPDLHDANMQPFAAQLFITLGALALARGKARARDVILVAAFAYASLRASRNILYFALVSFPILVEYVGQWFDTQRTWQWLGPGPNPKMTGVINLIVLLVLTGVVGTYAWQAIERQSQLQLATYPVHAANFIQASHPPAPLYNTYNWGGYLIWQLYPEYQVFIDGRADVYTDPFFRAYADAQNDEFKGLALLTQYGIRTAIFPAGDALAGALSRDPAWQVIFRDSVAVVLTRK
ncbi:MAG TPA: hypothetical protein VIX58_00930 [Anaerolineae bacterium]